MTKWQRYYQKHKAEIAAKPRSAEWYERKRQVYATFYQKLKRDPIRWARRLENAKANRRQYGQSIQGPVSNVH